MKKTTQLRELLKQPGIIVAPGAHNAFAAKIIEQTGGFQAVYMTGSGAAMSLIGEPDVGLLTMTEMVTQARNLVNAVHLPVIADADTGYGNALNVVRTVREFERSGVAAIHLEDQITPKKCGHFEGKQVVSQNEMVGKIKAAVDTREDPDFVIIARTDARAVLGFGEAIQRANAYVEAGADVIFFEAPQSMEELKTIVQSIRAPLLVNMDEGTKTPLLTVKELEEMGFRIVIFPRSIPCVAAKAIQELVLHLKETGSTQGFLNRIVTFEGRNLITGLAKYKEMEKKYLALE
ncbi:MAG: isocitrate lyase/phosphoenolpyruvate mutase family protein [Thermodesulfobacteriota bacterium]|nr:isocitrate lyase/phosphoenolpyruvate mutase family protein [Thermodesulfobacteriota bacterium]